MQLFGATLKLKPWSVCSVPVRAGYSVVAYLQRIGSQNWEPLNTRNAAFWGHIEIRILVCVFCAHTGKENTEGIAPSTHQTKSLHGQAALHPNACRLSL